MADDSPKKTIRVNPECAACPRRVSNPGDDYCKKCLALRDRTKPWRHRVRRAKA